MNAFVPTGGWWPGGTLVRLRRRTRLLALAGILLAVSGCVYLPQGSLPDPATLTPEERADQNEFVFDAAWNLVHRGYFSVNYNDLDWAEARARHLAAARAAADEEALYDAINAMLHELNDDHTHALSPSESEALHRERRVLLGLMLRPVDLEQPQGPLLVFATLAGSHAAESGIEPGWVLVSCDGRRPGDVLGERRLQENQRVQCVFRDRENRERTIDLVARPVSTAPVLSVHELEDDLVLLRFDKFDRESARWLRRQLKEHHDAAGIILDLRQNPGGDAAALGRMLGEFFTHRVDMGTFITRRGINDHLQAWRWIGSASYRGPLAVLVSANSASSSEIFAAVIQHHERGILVGEQTAGAVLASRFFPLPGGGRLQLSIDDYMTPGGRRLENQGVIPDIAVTTTTADLRAGRDPALQAAISHLQSGGNGR